MTCPHCTVTIHPAWQSGVIHPLPENEGLWQWEKMICPACQHLVIRVRLVLYVPNDSVGAYQEQTWQEVAVFPLVHARAAIGPGVPDELLADYKEALAVLPVSAKASAALSRRVLQSILKDQGYNEWNLADQIDRLIDETLPDKVLPPGIRTHVDVIRQFGNFSAHRITDKNTLQVIPVAPEEAEWCLEIIERLFDHYYVVPAANKKRLDEFNQRLQLAGQKPTKS